MKYWFIRGAVIIVLTVIYIIIMVIKADRDLSLDDGFLFATVLMAGDSLSKVCVCTSMFRKNMGKGLKKADNLSSNSLFSSCTLFDILHDSKPQHILGRL